MDYSKSGSAKAAKTTPRPKRATLKGAPKAGAPDAAGDKAALLARMKAAAQKPS